ncbi:MAG: transglutaminase family protein, partial [Verrucomicrobiaceae bacterium]|nr:transglutaminase family protein [Verrucomicrobiaceae bacterium]
MKHYRISHTTSYTYDGLVSLCHNEARLTPRPFAWQACVSSAVTTTPLPSNKRDRRDFFGNRVHYFAIQEPHEQLTITVTSEVSIA